eukprot:3256055-Rhodomonas_salina.2
MANRHRRSPPSASDTKSRVLPPALCAVVAFLWASPPALCCPGAASASAIKRCQPPARCDDPAVPHPLGWFRHAGRRLRHPETCDPVGGQELQGRRAQCQAAALLLRVPPRRARGTSEAGDHARRVQSVEGQGAGRTLSGCLRSIPPSESARRVGGDSLTSCPPPPCSPAPQPRGGGLTVGAGAGSGGAQARQAWQHRPRQ